MMTLFDKIGLSFGERGLVGLGYEKCEENLLT